MSDDDLVLPSKSQRKREAQALRLLGEQLVQLKPVQLEKIPLTLELLDAIRFAQQLHQRGAHKRQLQYIGKLLRSIDPEPIQTALQAITIQDAAAKGQQRYLEQICTAFVAADNQALSDFLQRYPQADRQHIRQLIRNAQYEQRGEKPPKSRRLLFRYLRSVLESTED